MTYEPKEPVITHDLTLTGSVVVEPTDDLLFDTLGEALMKSAVKAVEEQGVFHLALSGGSTPEPFYRRLCLDPRFRLFPWQKTHVWLVDERRVPEGDDRLNFKMIKSVLIDHVSLRSKQVHPMPVMLADAAEQYEAKLRELVPTGRLDFVLLGMGDDGHTASLFPGSDGLAVNDRWVDANEGPKVTPPPRLTMTYPLLNAAKELAILATGQKKAGILQAIQRQLRVDGVDIQKYPVTGIQPQQGKLTWYLDAASAGAKVEE